MFGQSLFSELNLETTVKNAIYHLFCLTQSPKCKHSVSADINNQDWYLNSWNQLTLTKCCCNSSKIWSASALTVPTHSLMLTCLLYCVCVVRSPPPPRPFRNCGHRDRDSPWRCPQSTVLGNNSRLCMGPWQERSRLRASIPDTFPLFPPSIPPNPPPPASPPSPAYPPGLLPTLLSLST